MHFVSAIYTIYLHMPARLVLVDRLGDLDSKNDREDDKNDEDDNKADPSLFPCGAG